jgi:phenylacetate-CoA ligase
VEFPARSEWAGVAVNAEAKKERPTDESVIAQLIPPAELKPSFEDVARLPSFHGKIQACEKIFGTPYGETEFAIQDALVLRRLQQMVNTLLLNPLWAERFKQAGLSAAPRDFDEWQAIPLSDKNVMRDFFMGARSGMVVPLSHGGFEIVASGGTSSGLPVETVYSLRELRDTYEIAGDFMGRYQLRDYLTGSDPKWVLTTLADYQMWSSGTMVGGVLQRIPDINYIGAGPVTKEVYQHIMSYPGPKAILGISAGIAILGDLGAGLSEAARNSFRVALYGSGVLPHRKQLELKALYPNLNILSYFAATQAETIGLQLRPDSPVLSAVPGLHLIEIVDENGRWVAEGEEGELVVTRLHAHEAPLPRLKLGDRMIRRADLTGPGLKTRQFEFAGRSGDVIHLCDTQYAARLVYASLCREILAIGGFDLQVLSHDVQFQNKRKIKTLSLIASVDNPELLNAHVYNRIGHEVIRRVFLQSLVRSLSLFNAGEANPHSIEKTGYRFELRFVGRASEEILRTAVGKVPLLKDEA